MKTVIAGVLALLFLLPIGARGGSQASQAPAKDVPAPAASTSPTPPTSQATPTPGDDQRIRALDDRVQKLEHAQENGWIVALIGALAVLAAALVGIVGQHFAAKSEDRRSIVAAGRAAELARQEALYKHTEKILEFRLKQMEQFYAPMFALLGQSEGLYNKMRHQLIQDEPGRYRWAPDADPKDGKMQVLGKDGRWQGFRLLDQFPAVRKNARALALADQVLEIGKKITTIISQHAGLASEDMLEVLGKYLAHFAILSAVRGDERTEPYPPGSHEMGYYPRELNSKIESGYREVTQFIGEYAKASKNLVNSLPGTDSKPGA